MSIIDINNDSDILTNYTLQLELLESDGEPNSALQHAVDIITENTCNINTENTTISPIILGCPFSSMSIRTAAVLGAYHYGQISGGATSISLMDNELYPFFYRTIPNDSQQGKALIELARELGWTKIGVVHFDGMCDEYNFYLLCMLYI